MGSKGILKAGGICLIILAILDIGIGIINALVFSYPKSLSGNLQANLPLVFGHNIVLHDLLAYKALLPLLLIPGAVATYCLFTEKSRGGAMTAMLFAIVGAAAWVISASIWPSFNWFVAQSLMNMSAPTKLGQVAAAPQINHVVFMLIGGMNSFFQVFIGTYMKIICLTFWLFILGIIGLTEKRLPSWFCYFGIVLAVIAWVLLFLRIFISHPYILSYGLSFFPIVNLWIFLLGCYLLLPRADRV